RLVSKGLLSGSTFSFASSYSVNQTAGVVRIPETPKTRLVDALSGGGETMMSNPLLAVEMAAILCGDGRLASRDLNGPHQSYRPPCASAGSARPSKRAQEIHLCRFNKARWYPSWNRKRRPLRPDIAS